MIQDGHILFDSCILNNLLSKEADLASQTQKLLETFLKENNTFYVSEFTHYELLRSADNKQKEKCEKTLTGFLMIENNEQRRKRATQLYTLYKNNPYVCKNLSSIPDVDIFIGSLIFTQHHPYLLTADFLDFPRPFFKEKELFKIEFKKNRGNKNCIYYYLLEANLEAFKDI